MSIIFKQFQDSREDQGNNQQDIFQNIAFYQYRGVFCIIKINQSYFARRNTTEVLD